MKKPKLTQGNIPQITKSQSSASNPVKNPGGCGCPGGSCNPITRREFLVTSSLGVAAAFLADPLAQAADLVNSTASLLVMHPIPADKHLPAGWIKSLFEKGGKSFWRGKELRTIGMPIGGIGAGQLYLCGDGTLGQWEIFNEHEFIGWGAKNYAPRTIPKPVDHGLAIFCEARGKITTRQLDESGFTDVAFRGEYPIGTVHYNDPDSPLAVTLEAFSPFIPLNATDSALPATFLDVTLENTSRSPVRAGVLSWLENPIAQKSAEEGFRGRRKSRVLRTTTEARILHSAESSPDDEIAKTPRETIIFNNFETSNYGEWKTTGLAFGDGPSTGTLPHQQKVSGFQDNGFANSFVGGDKPDGTLTSPVFTISRRYINFLLGGGNKEQAVVIRLLIDGKKVRKATGKDSEQMTWRSWDVREYEGKQAQLVILDNSTEPWGHILVDQIEFADTRRDEGPDRIERYPDFGTITWTCLADTLSSEEARSFAASFPAEVHTRLEFDDWASDSLSQQRNTALLTRPIKLQPGEKKSFVFLLSWHFPNTVKPSREAGHEYAARFTDAAAVADYALKHRDRLMADTRKWRDTWYDSTLPFWLLDRLHIPISCLATGTAQWWKNGRFWAFEGVVCCEGTCTHVWNYSQALARLFPELERNVRERQDLGVGLQPDGLVGMRHNSVYAADGQCGTVLKAWREHLLSPDDQFLRRNWPNIRKVLDYSIKQDENDDGLIENNQPNTYDIDFFGPNTYVGALYLAALRAGEQMARELGDESYASRLKQIYESGKRLSEEKLWNGEYFFQVIDLKKHEKHQYGEGCLSDQLFGQNWALQVGLGHLYSPDKVKKALESVWRYNWAPDTGPYNKAYPTSRPFVEPTEAGLINCTWPKSEYLKEGVLYREEVWTGIEYQVAAHMIYEGMIEEGLAICRSIHDRYHPAKRNPYNEVECSDFYARAMASWGVLLAISGFQYHGPKGFLAFAPRLNPENFRCAFTTAEGWGTFEQILSSPKCSWTLDLRHGQLHLQTLELDYPKQPHTGIAMIKVGTTPIQATYQLQDKKLVLQFKEGILITPAHPLLITMS